MKKHNFSIEPQNIEEINTKNRVIRTAIPSRGTKEVLMQIEKYESRSMQGQMPIVWDKAENFNVFDKNGNKWIDFTSTIFVSNVGHGNKNVLDAVKKVLDKPLLHSYAYLNQERTDYHKKLIEFASSPFEKAFLLSAGTEATEAALKLMRLHSKKTGKARPGIICIEGNWHGRTLGAQMMSGNINQKEWIGYHDPNIHHIPFPYPWDLNQQCEVDFLEDSLKNLSKKGIDIQNDICGFMLETFQGWGAIFYPENFVKKIRKICDEHDILLAFDEMQSGFARTGEKFGYEHYNVKADLLCCGKGIASGFPLSAVIGTKKIMDLPEVGNMSSTHSANPIVCAAGLATIGEIERLNLVEETKRKGDILFSKLENLKQNFPDCISHVMGKGLIASILFKEPKSNLADNYFPSLVCEKAMQKGLLLVHTGRESIKIGPPLTITDEALVEGLNIIDESIRELLL